MNQAVDHSVFVRPHVHWKLLAAIRFRDAFTHDVVKVALNARILPLGLVAQRHERDSLYCFVASTRELPVGTFEVQVESLGGEYVAWQNPQLTLPVSPSPSPLPQPLRDRFQVEYSIWPTRRFATCAGETTLVVQVQRSGADQLAGDLRIKLVRLLELPTLETRSDSNGEGFFRVFPAPAPVGGIVPATEMVSLEVFDASDVPLPIVSGSPLELQNNQLNFVTLQL